MRFMACLRIQISPYRIFHCLKVCYWVWQGRCWQPSPRRWKQHGSPPDRHCYVSHLETSARRLVVPAALAGVLALGAGFTVIHLSSPSIELGFCGIFIIILGVTLLIPLVTVVLMACLKPLLGRSFGISGRYACQSVTASPEPYHGGHRRPDDRHRHRYRHRPDGQ